MTHTNTEPAVPGTDNDRIAQVADQLRQLHAYGPVAVITRSEGYTSEKGHKPWPADSDQRRSFRLGHSVLTITEDEDTVSVSVAAPDGERALPLDEIEKVTVDHPLGRYMPLHGKQMMALGLQPWDGHENVIRWLPRAFERWDGSHLHSVFETELDATNPAVGIIRAYDISTPWDARTSLAEAKAAGRPHGLYLVSILGAAGVQSDLETDGSLTVVTSRMGYTGGDRMVTVLPPRDRILPRREFAMMDVTGSHDVDAYDVHLDRLERLYAEQGAKPSPLTQFQVDDAFLYATHD